MGPSRAGTLMALACLIILTCHVPHAAGKSSRKLLAESSSTQTICHNDTTSAPPAILMHMTLSLMKAESVNGSSEPCVSQLLGSGIFTPTNVARGLKIVAEAMYNAWTMFDDKALPTVGGKVAAPASSADQSSAKACATAAAAYKAMAFLLPEGVVRLDIAGQIKTGLSVDVLAPLGTSSCPADVVPSDMGIWINQHVEDMMAPLRASALADGFNQ
eukprot:jgi/Mesen1/6160/ME000314S05148